MEYQSLIILVIAVGATLLLLSAIRQKSEGLINFVLRIVMGILLIVGGNTGIAMLGMTGGVGINAATVLTSGILGFPGVVGLFVIFFYNFL